MRSSGVLMHISSLPSPYGIGTMGKAAVQFVDFLEEAGQTYWQILPVCPTSYGDSPYQSFSSFAGNPYFIDLDYLCLDGLLKKEECEAYNWGGDETQVDYGILYENRYDLLKKAFARFKADEPEDFKTFCEEEAEWLDNYALFMALKDANHGAAWFTWDRDLKFRKAEALEKVKEDKKEDIAFWKMLQYLFYKQWRELKDYANVRGIKIIGDVPIYVAGDSADVWANPEQFYLNEDLEMIDVAGCPPDAFSATGQLWGNPLYRWDYHRNTGYQWWISRMSYCFRLYDVVRIDHFRGFDEYFSIPYGDKDARGGHWEKGPGIDLFRKIEQALGWKQVIAEDLGYMTDSVRHLVYESGFPGMKVLEFAFDSRDSGCASDYLPHNYPENCVAYTGTHDNETIVGWWKSITVAERKLARDYLCDHATPEEELYKCFISLIMRSAARVCVIPMQDYMGLDNRFRMNKPSTVGMNWKWRIKKRDLTKKLQKEIYDVTLRYGRKNWD